MPNAVSICQSRTFLQIRTLSPFLLFWFACFLGIPTPTAGQEVVVLQPDGKIDSDTLNRRVNEVTRNFFVERLGVHVIRRGDYAIPIMLTALERVAADNPSLSSEDLTYIAKNMTYYIDNPEASAPSPLPEDFADKAIGKVAGMAVPKPIAPFTEDAVPFVLEIAREELRSQIAALYALDKEQLQITFAEHPENLDNIYDAAKRDPRVEPAINAVLSRYGMHLEDSPANISDPVLDEVRSRNAISQIQQGLGQLPTKADLQQLAIRQTDRLVSSLGRMNGNLERYLQAQNKKEEKDKEFASFQYDIAEARAGAFLLSTTLRFIDPSLSRAIGITANAVINVIEAQALMTKFGKIGALSLTASYVSCAMALVSIFDSGSNADAAILESIRALQRQIQQLQKEMHARFDRIDERLNAIYVDMLASFNQVNRNIAQARAGILTLQAQVYKIQDEMGELDRRAQSYSQSLSEQLISANLDVCLHGGADEWDDSMLSRCVRSLVTTATETAKSSVWTNAPGKGQRDLRLMGDLDKPVEQNIPLMLELASNRFSQNIAQLGEIPNPIVYATAVAGYLQVIAEHGHLGSLEPTGFSNSNKHESTLVEQSGHRSYVDHGETQKLTLAGEQITNVIKVLAEQRNGSRLSDRILSEYKKQIGEMAVDVGLMEKDFEQSQLAGYDPWGNLPQINAASSPSVWNVLAAPGGLPQPRAFAISFCSPEDKVYLGETISPPKSLAALIPPIYRMADELRLGTLTVCYSHPQWTLAGRAPNSPQLQNHIQAKYSLDLEVRFAPDDTLFEEAAGKGKSQEKKQFLLVTHRRASSERWRRLNCGYLEMQAFEKTHDLAGCLNNMSVFKSNDFLKNQFQYMWDGTTGEEWWPFEGNLPPFKETYPANAEELEADRVAKDLESAKAIVELELSRGRAAIRNMISEAISGALSDSAFVGQGKAMLIRDFRELWTIEKILDLYVSLVLSRSIRDDDELVSRLIHLEPSYWATEIQKAGGRRLVNPDMGDKEPERSLVFLQLLKRIDQTGSYLNLRLRSGAEPYDLVESKLSQLNTLKYIEYMEGLSNEHVCLKSHRIQRADAIRQSVPPEPKKYFWDFSFLEPESDALRSLNFICAGESNGCNVQNVVISTQRGKIVSVANIPQSVDSYLVDQPVPLRPAVQSDGIRFSVPANGLNRDDIKTADIEVCGDFSPRDPDDFRLLLKLQGLGGDEKVYSSWRITNLKNAGLFAVVLQTQLH